MFAATIMPVVMNILRILLAILIFGLLIFIHELGHFLTAKWSGIKVNEFALGMGPTLLKFQRGETKYAVRAFPIGGFVAMEGENEESDNSRAFCNASLGKRFLVTVAGAVMNLLLGLLLLGILSGMMPSYGTTTIRGFYEDAVSNQSLQTGDEILRINGHRVNTYNDITYEMSRSRDGVLEMQVNRDGENVNLSVTFTMEEYEDGVTSIYPDFAVERVDRTPLRLIRHTFNWTQSVIKQVWGGFIDLITGRYTVNQLSGPVGVTQVIGSVVTSSSGNWLLVFQRVMLLVSIITVNLGVFNLLPIPALDGGRLLFLCIELVRRKPINPKYEGLIHGVGFLLLLGLMLVVTFNDIIKIIPR